MSIKVTTKVRPRKQTGLLYGDATKIANIHRCSVQHVAEVAAGRRPGRTALQETIRKYQELARLRAQAETAGGNDVMVVVGRHMKAIRARAS